MTEKMTLNPRSKVPGISCVTKIHKSQISACFAPTPAIFKLQAILRHQCTEWLQNDLGRNKVKCTPYMLLVPPVPNLLHFALRCKVTGHSETSAPNDPKMTNPQGQRYPIYTCITGSPKSKISISFALRPAFFAYNILRIVYRMTPKWHWTLQGQMYPICVLAVSPDSQISVPFRSTANCF